MTRVGSLTSAGLRVLLEVAIRYELGRCPDALRRRQAGVRDRSRIGPGGRVMCPDDSKLSQAGAHVLSRTRRRDCGTPQRAFQYASGTLDFHAD